MAYYGGKRQSRQSGHDSLHLFPSLREEEAEERGTGTGELLSEDVSGNILD